MVLRAVALSVFRESVRDRVFYNLLLFAVLLVGASVLIGQMTAGQDLKIIKDLGLAATSLFGLFIAVFVGIGLVWKEVERRSVYSLLAKPVRRPELVLGKYLGLAFTLLVNVLVMAVVLYAPARLHALVSSPENVRAGMGGAGRRSRAAEGLPPDLRPAAAGDGHRAVLLDLLEPDAVGGADIRVLRRSATSTPT